MSDLEIPGAGGSANVSDAAYDATAWDGDTDAPTKNAIRDKIETLTGGHDPVTVTDSAEIDFTLTDQEVTAFLVADSIAASKLDAAVNVSLGKADSAVQNTGNETVAGVKTFSSSPIIPAPSTDLQAATKKYVDDNAGGTVDVVSAKFVKLTTTSTADANSSSEMKIAWDTLVIDEKDDALTHDISTNNSRITLDQDGYYRGFVNIGFSGSTIRVAPRVRVKVNNTTYLPEEARHTYIRATSGHNDSSANFSFVVEADAGDYIEVTSIQGAAGGTLNIDGASLTVEKYEIGKQGEKGDPGSGGTVDVVSNVATDRILGRNTAGTGDSEELTAAAARTLLNVEDGATADQTGAQIKTAYEAEANAFTDTKNTKLSGIESDADKTDTANVEAAGALMDSEVTNLAQVKAFDSSDYEPTKEIDDNYVTDDEKVVIGNTSGTNTGDQDINIGDQVIIFENNLI